MVRNELAVAQWGVQFEELSFEQKTAVASVYPIRILVYPNYSSNPQTLALPQSEVQEILSAAEEDSE